MNEIDFLREKIQVFAMAIDEPSNRMGFIQMWTVPLEGFVREGNFSKAKAVRFDRYLDGHIRELFPHAMAESTRAKLREKFGFDSLGKNPEAVIPRILKRGRILNDAEAEMVRSFVANQGNENGIGKEAFDRLAKLLDEAGY
jgi:hypothetical protein